MKLWSQVEGDGVDPSQLQQESVGIDIFTSSHAKKQAFSRAKSLTWTETDWQSGGHSGRPYE